MIKVIGKSLGIFSPTNPVRVLCHAIVSNSYYNSVVLILIGLSTIVLAIDNPLYDQSGTLVYILGIIDVAMTIIFTVECLIKELYYDHISSVKFKLSITERAFY
mgnify:CR=1 FL=1